MVLPLSALFAAVHALLRMRGFALREIACGPRRVLAYDRRGAGGGPPAILVHGLGGSAASFSLLAPELAAVARRVVVLELPGHGRNALRPDEQPAEILEHAQAVALALEDLGEPAVLIGNTLGGALCLHTAATTPARVRGVVGLAPAGAPLAGGDRETLRHAFRGGLEPALEMPGRLYRRPPRLATLFARDFARHWSTPAVQRLVAPIGDQPLP